MATLKIQRTKEYINRFRNYSIELDGQKVGKIANGETKDIMISPGVHKLVFHIDWCSSPEVEFFIENDQVKIVKVSGFEHSKWVMPLGLGVGLASIFVDELLGWSAFVYCSAPLFFLLFYHLTFGRNRYLTIST